MATNLTTNELYEQCVLKNYGPKPVNLVKGKGIKAWDDQGREYLDFTTGIAVNNLGHCHPVWVKRIQEQASQLAHCTNLFGIPNQAKLASALCERAGEGKVFFCNSGAEATEALVKLSRLFGREKAGEEGKCYTVVSATEAFHGRTFAGMSATPQEKIQGGFRPLVPGFRHAERNNIESFAEKIDEDTAAVLIEPVQGESGIYPSARQFMKDLRALCDERNVLLLVDEVQCGIGRTGKFFAFEHAEVTPDAIGLAKGLGGGFPIGAMWVSQKYSNLFKPGSHGSTFGGSPLACAAALAVIEVMETENLLANATEQGVYLKGKLEELARSYPQLVAEVRGLGLHIGISLKADHLAVIGRLRENGLLVVGAGNKTVRFLPPLNVTRSEIDEALDIFEKTLLETEPEK